MFLWWHTFEYLFQGSKQGRKVDLQKIKAKKGKRLVTGEKLYVHTVINKTFFRYKVCIQACIFIDRNDQLGVSVGKQDELQTPEIAE